MSVNSRTRSAEVVPKAIILARKCMPTTSTGSQGNNELIDSNSPATEPKELSLPFHEISRQQQVAPRAQQIIIPSKQTRFCRSQPNKDRHSQFVMGPDSSSLWVDTGAGAKSIVENQVKTAEKLNYFVKMQEEFTHKLFSETGLLAASAAKEPLELTFEPVDTIKKCIEFEDELRNLRYCQALFQKFGSICNEKSGLLGDDAAYALIDYIFTRRFFTLVSMTGNSRSTKEKQSFKQFERIFQFFFVLVGKVDSSYTKVEMKKFFQKIISNSKRRLEPAKRASRVKHRRSVSSIHRAKNVAKTSHYDAIKYGEAEAADFIEEIHFDLDSNSSLAASSEKFTD